MAHGTAPLGFEERFRVVEARDPRFDGQFVMAVRTTGIYCRPSCPARTPRRENVTFYPTSAAAHEAGYRACRRCLPEAVPGSPEWDLRGDTVGRVMRLIADGVVEREGVGALAARVGYSPRHLRRLLTDELGAGPLALARSRRAHTARLLLTGTDLAVADVAFAAGFGSVRQCNDTIREVFASTPTRLRAARRGVAPTPGALDLVLAVREPFDAEGVFGWLQARAVPGMEASGPGCHTRTLRLPAGPARVEVRRDPGTRGAALRMRAWVTGLSDLPVLVARVRRLFDLDSDPRAVDTALAAVPELAPRLARLPGVRVPGTVDPHELVIRTMVGQQVSVAGARTALGRLVARLGDEGGGTPHGQGTAADPHGGPHLLFPTMEAIAEHGAEVLTGPRARIEAVTGVAARLADGSLQVGFGDDGGDQRDALVALAGIGPWTADHVRMRVLGDPDVFLPGDSAVRAGAGALGLPTGAGALAAWARHASPWRSYLTMHLWHVAGEAGRAGAASAATGTTGVGRAGAASPGERTPAPGGRDGRGEGGRTR